MTRHLSPPQVNHACLDAAYGGKGKEVRDKILSVVGSACLMPAATRPHLIVLPFGSEIVGELGDYLNQFMINATTAAGAPLTETQAKAFGCGVPIAAPGAFDPYKFIGRNSYFFTAMPPASTFPAASVEAVMGRNKAKTYGFFTKGRLMDFSIDTGTAGLTAPWKMYLQGTLGPGYSNIKEVGKLCSDGTTSSRHTWPEAADHIRCDADADCPAGQTCISPQFNDQISCMGDAVDQLAWMEYWKSVNPDVLFIGSASYDDMQNFILAMATRKFAPKAIVSMAP